MDALSLNLVRSIHDPIHGSIKMSNIEMDVIEKPLFRRLHYIRQNSFLYKVFPSAKHTRFEHSIGVMHMAHKMLAAVIENSGIAAQRGDIESDSDAFRSLLDERNGVGVNLYSLNTNVKNQAYKELRLAALLHDIGHGPLSHLFDAFAPTCDEFEVIIDAGVQDSDIALKMKDMVSKFKTKGLQKGKTPSQIRVEHEHVSSYFIYRILSSLKEDVSTIRNVLTILKPELDLGKLVVEIHGTQFNILKLLNDLVASAPIDCDRMDYLKRDSYFVGVPYGNYSEDRVLKTLLPYATSDMIRLGLKNSGLHAVENFLQARYELYVQVYGHKTNEAAKAIVDFASEKNLPFTQWSNINFNATPQKLVDDFEQLYSSLTDEDFLGTIINNINDNKGRAALQKLDGRKLWKRVYEVEEFVTSGEKSALESVFEDAFKKMKGQYPEIIQFKGDRFPLKDVNEGAKLLEKSSKSVYVLAQKQLSQASQIIDSLNRGLCVRRIYSVGRHETSDLKEYTRSNVDPIIQQILNLNRQSSI